MSIGRRAEGVGVLSLLLALAPATMACGPVNVERQILLECLSPGGTSRAIYWHETTGVMAVGSADAWVTVSAADVRSAEVLRSTDPEGTVLRFGESPDLRFVWKDDGRLDVEYPSGATVVRETHSRGLNAPTSPDVVIATKAVGAPVRNKLPGGLGCGSFVQNNIDLGRPGRSRTRISRPACSSARTGTWRIPTALNLVPLMAVAEPLSM